MTQVNVLEAKNNLSRLLRDLESGAEDCFVIARNGAPVAKIVLYDSSTPQTRIGVAAGRTLVQEGWDIDEDDDEVAALFGVE